MLKPCHIVNFKMNIARLAAHSEMPPPEHAMRQLTAQLSAVGDAVISELFNIDPVKFEEQLTEARKYNAAYLMHGKNGVTIAIAAPTSLIKPGNIIRKNMIVPKQYTHKPEDIDKHIMIGVFLFGNVCAGQLERIDEIKLAGWTDTEMLNQWKFTALPDTFKTKLSVVAMPCARLYPIKELPGKLKEYMQ